MTPEEKKQEEELDKLIASFTHDPLKFVKFAYPWGEGELEESPGPRKWQTETLNEIGRHLQNSATRYQPFRKAVASGHGVGKTADIAMIIDWAMSTCEDCIVICTAQTGTQLRTKTVPEVHKWFTLSINRHWWELKSESICSTETDHQKRWHTDFITWNAGNAQAFAGAHNKGKRILVIFDEASEIDKKIWEVVYGALTDERTEIIWIVYGNPTEASGGFFECFGSMRHMWHTKQIDSREVEGTNKVEIQRWIDQWGEDSDFVRVRVKGQFPRVGSNTFISSEVVERCRKYKARGYEGLPVILTCDPARFGDDTTRIGKRQGRRCTLLATYRGMGTDQVGEHLIEFIKSENPDATVIDADGLGAGVVDHLSFRGYTDRVFEFHGGEGANNPNEYFNKRAECWGKMRDMLTAGMEIPDTPEMAADLTNIRYGFSSNGSIQLELKEDLKKRGLPSPDLGDMLAMSFGVDVLPRKKSSVRSAMDHGDAGWMA